MEMSSCLLPCPSKVWGDVSVLPVTSPGVLTLPLQFRAAATPDTSLEISKHPNMDVDTPQHVRNPPCRLLLLSKSYKPKAVTEPSLVHSAASAAAQMTTSCGSTPQPSWDQDRNPSSCTEGCCLCVYSSSENKKTSWQN